MLYFIPDVALAQGGYTVASRAIGIASNIPAAINYFSTGGYYTEGDGGGAIFVRVAGPLNDGASFQSNDGAWWQLCDKIPNCRQFGAVGDYAGDPLTATDDTVAVQKLFNFGAPKVDIMPGDYYITDTITVPDYLHISGAAFPLGIGADNIPVCFSFNLASGIGFDVGISPLFEYMYIRNVAGVWNDTTDTLSGTTATGIKLVGNITINFVTFSLWAKNVSFGAATYYATFNYVESNRSTIFYYNGEAVSYDVFIQRPISRKTNQFISGTAAFPIRNVQVFGGSVEGYDIISQFCLEFTWMGGYSETTSQHTGAFAITPQLNGACVTIKGGLHYMNYLARFVDMSSQSDCLIDAAGNNFETSDGPTTAGGIIFYLPASGTVNIGFDRVSPGLDDTCLYVDSLNNAFKYNIVMPDLPATNTQAAYSSMNIIGPQGYLMSGLSVAPSAPIVGQTVMANGDTWDPLARAAGRPYWVIWQGDRWFALSGA